MNKWKRTSASLPRHSQREMRDTYAGGGCRKCGHPNPAKISFFGPLDSPQMSFFGRSPTHFPWLPGPTLKKKKSFFGPLDPPQMSFFEVPVGTSGCMHWIDLTLLVPNIW